MVVVVALAVVWLMSAVRTAALGAATEAGATTGADVTTGAGATTKAGTTTEAGTTTGAGATAEAGTTTGPGTMTEAGPTTEAMDDHWGTSATDAPARLWPALFVAPSTESSGCEKPFRTLANVGTGKSLSNCGTGVETAIAPVAAALSLLWPSWLSLFGLECGCRGMADEGPSPPGSKPGGRHPDCGVAPAGLPGAGGTVLEEGGGAETVTQGVLQIASQRGETPFSSG